MFFFASRHHGNKMGHPAIRGIIGKFTKVVFYFTIEISFNALSRFKVPLARGQVSTELQTESLPFTMESNGKWLQGSNFGWRQTNGHNERCVVINHFLGCFGTDFQLVWPANLFQWPAMARQIFFNGLQWPAKIFAMVSNGPTIFFNGLQWSALLPYHS